MSNLMVRYDSSLFCTHDTVFLLFTYKYNFHCLKEVFLTDNLSAMLNCSDCSLIDHIGKI